MRVLLVHNFYGSSAPSGENLVYESERSLLAQRGHEVEEFTRHSDEIRTKGAIGTVQGALSTAWNQRMVREIRRKSALFRPHVVHVHNTFPLISPGIFQAVGHRAARLLTLHNYRLFCSAAIPLRDGMVCTECLDSRSSWPSIRHGCYRGSRFATLPLALSVWLHRALGTWSKNVDAFIALSDFQRTLMTTSGLPDAKVYVKPNFFPGLPAMVQWTEREPYAVFVGRLSAEKRVKDLLLAWKEWGADAPELRIVGGGELCRELERMASRLPVNFLGQVSREEALNQIARAHLLVLPSVCFEGFPMVLLEAFAFGTPVAVSDIGPLPCIVQQGANGLVFDAANPVSLLREVREAWDSPGVLKRLSQGARAAFEEKYTETVNYRVLMGIYEDAIVTSRKRTQE